MNTVMSSKIADEVYSDDVRGNGCELPRITELTRKDLVPLRNACNVFLLVWLCNSATEEINRGAALAALRLLRAELNNVAAFLRGEGHA